MNKIFKNPIILSFEPIKSDFDIMYKKFSNDFRDFYQSYFLSQKNRTWLES